METKSPQKSRRVAAMPDLPGGDDVPRPNNQLRQSPVDVSLPERNLVPVMSTSLNLCIWFHYRAGLDGDILQPMKLQRLIYLAQALYAAKSNGRRLIPATFIATERGPIEPNIYQLYEHGAPTVGARRPGEELEQFLEVIWRKYGHHNPDHLLRLISRDSAFFDTLHRHPNGEITIDAMATEYQRNTEGKRVEVKNYSQDGKLLKGWKPRQVAKATISLKDTQQPTKGDHPLPNGLPWRRIK